MLTPANAQAAATVGMRMPENMLQIFVYAMEFIVEVIDADSASGGRACVARGSANVSVADNDADLLISAGDTVTVDFTDCLELSLIGAVDGSISVSISEFSELEANPGTMRGSITLASPITFEREDNDTRIVTTEAVQGTFDFALIFYGFSESLALASRPGTELTGTIGGVTDRVSNVFITRDGAANAYRFGIEADIESESIGGSFACATESVIDDEDDGSFVCDGAAGSRLRLTVREPGPFLDLQVDPEGDGTFSDVAVDAGTGFDPTLSLYSDKSYVDDTTSTPLIRVPAMPATAAGHFLIDMNSFVFNAADGLVYATTDAGVSVIDPDALTEVDSVALANPANPIAVSDDGSTLWVGFNFVSEILPITTSTLTPGAPIALSGSRSALDIEIAPGTTDTVVVSDVRGDDLFGYAAGVPFANEIVNNFGAPAVFEFTSPSTIVGINGDVGYVASLDANGLSLTKEIEGAVAGNATIGDPFLYGAFGGVFDLANDAIHGKINLDDGLPGASSRDGGAYDPATNTIYFYRSGSGSFIDFYDSTTLVPLGKYQLSIPQNVGFGITVQLTGDGRMVIGGSDGLVIVDLAALTPNIDLGDCVTNDYSDVRMAGSYFEISCGFNDAVYDPTRDLIYASLPSREPRGNSVAIVNPQTGVVEAYVAVGSEPGELALSDDGSLLYVALTGASRAVVVDPGTRQVVSTIDFPLESSVLHQTAAPARPQKLAISPTSINDVLVTTIFPTSIRYLQNGVQAGASEDIMNFVEFSDVFFGSTPSRAVTHRLGSIRILQADANGVSEITTASLGDSSRHAEMLGDILYTSEGTFFDTATLTARPGCELPDERFTAQWRRILTLGVVDPVVYYYRRNTQELLVCDRATLEMSGPAFIPNSFDTGLFTTAMLEAGTNRLMIVADTKAILFDPGSLIED